MMDELLVRRIDPDLPLPAPAHAGDAGMDLYAAEDVKIEAGERAGVRTGIAVAIPEGYAAFVVPRSGLAARHGIGVVNGPGLIDAGYRGEVKVLLVNHDPAEQFVVTRGDRIAQLVLHKVQDLPIREVDSLPESARGEGGFGSTGR